MAHVQTSALVRTTGASSLSPSLSGVSSGNSLVYCLTMWRNPSPSSSPPTGYTEDRESAAQQQNAVAIGSSHGVSSGTHTPSIGMGGNSWGSAVLLEYNGVTTAEGANSNIGNSQSPSTAAVTPGGSGSIMVACLVTAVSRVITPDWTERAETEDDGSGMPLSAVEKTGVTGSQTGTWSLNFSTDWAAAVVSYPAAAAGATSPIFPCRASQRALLVR